MFGFGGGFCVEVVEAEGVEVGVEFLEESGAKGDPFFGAELAFEDGFLDADAVVGAGACDAAEAAGAFFVGCGDVVCDEDEHRLFGDVGEVLWKISA